MTEDTGFYLVVTADATEEQARAAFIRRYNDNPEKVFRMYPNLTVWAGPAPKTEQE